MKCLCNNNTLYYYFLLEQAEFKEKITHILLIQLKLKSNTEPWEAELIVKITLLSPCYFKLLLQANFFGKQLY